MTNLRVLSGDGKRAEDVTAEMAERIKELIYKYDGRVTLAAAVGVLRIVEHEILSDHG